MVPLIVPVPNSTRPQPPAFIELSCRDADLQRGVFEAEWRLASRAVLQLLAISGLDLVKLDGAVRQAQTA